MTVEVQVDEGYHIPVPEVLRERLGIAPGDKLLVELRAGYAVLMPVPSDYGRRLRGLHREIWEGIDPQEYVRREREEWGGSS